MSGSAVTRIVGVYGPNQYGWADIKTESGLSLSTKKSPLIEAARQAQQSGAVYAIDFTTKQNGTYTNHYLSAIRQPAQEEVSQPAQGFNNLGPMSPEQFTERASSGFPVPAQVQQELEEKEKRIHRQSSTSNAARFLDIAERMVAKLPQEQQTLDNLLLIAEDLRNRAHPLIEREIQFYATGDSPYKGASLS